jgi:hypothetical protein
MAIYKLSATGVIDTTNNLFIPADPLNKDWVAYQQWVDEGNSADPMDIVTPTPINVTATVQESINTDIAYGSLVKALASHFGLSLEQITSIIAAQT